MLGENWWEVQQQWLHRLGNLTLTGYNSKYQDRPFDEKKTISRGFNESSVRLNKFVREQSVWTEVEMERRGRELAERALSIWPALVVDRSLVNAAEQADVQARAERGDVAEVPMSQKARELFELLQARIRDIDVGIIELAEEKSVSYHGPEFFLEVLPRKNSINLLLALDFNEVHDPSDIAQDASQWKFFVNAKHEGGVCVFIREAEDIDKAVPMVRQSHEMTSA